jgi:hypothetical protein
MTEAKISNVEPGVVDREKVLRRAFGLRMALLGAALFIYISGVAAAFWVSRQPPKVYFVGDDGITMGAVVTRYEYSEATLGKAMGSIVEAVFLRTNTARVEGLEDFFTPAAWNEIQATMETIPETKGFAQVVRIRQIRVQSNQTNFKEVWWEVELTSHSVEKSPKSIIYLSTAWYRIRPTDRNPLGWRCGGIVPIAKEDFFAREIEEELKRRTGGNNAP